MDHCLQICRPLANHRQEDTSLAVPTSDWDSQDNGAMVMLFSSVHSNYTMVVATFASSLQAWKILPDRFDCDTGSSTINLFRSIANLRY